MASEGSSVASTVDEDLADFETDGTCELMHRWLMLTLKHA